MSPNRIASAAGAVVFVAAGVWELVVALPWLGAVHLVIAAVLAAAAVRGERMTRPVNVATGAVLLGLGLFGLFSVGTPANVLVLGGAANVLHFAASAGLLATGLGAARVGEDG